MLKILLLLLSCLISNLMFSQSEIAYDPFEWEFKNYVDLIDFTQVEMVKTQLLTIDEDEEYPVSRTALKYNNTNQLVQYLFTNELLKEYSFDMDISYKTPDGIEVNSVVFTNSDTDEIKEERQLNYNATALENVYVKRFSPYNDEPDVFEVVYEGNGSDFIQETIYTSAKSINQQTQQWYQGSDDGGFRIIKKIFLDDELIEDRTDSIILDQNYLKTAQYEIYFGIASETRYFYNTRRIDISGAPYDYKELERIQVNGIDKTRYEYEYDDAGNWIIRKTYKMKNGNWEYSFVTKRTIKYR